MGWKRDGRGRGGEVGCKRDGRGEGGEVGCKREGRGEGGEVVWKRDGRGGGGSEMSMETPRNVATRSATHWNSDVGKGLRKSCEATNVPDTPMDISQNQTLVHVVRVPDVNTYTLHLGAIRLRKVRRTV